MLLLKTYSSYFYFVVINFLGLTCSWRFGLRLKAKLFDVCAFAEVSETACMGDNHLFHAIVDGGESVVEFRYHAIGNHALAFQRLVVAAVERWNHAVIIVGITKHTTLFEAENQRHIVVWRKSFGCFGGDGVGVGVED